MKLDSRPTLTDQQIFDRVATHLLKQNAKALNTKRDLNGTNAACSYLNDRGQRCAIGILFQDDEASNKLAATLDGGISSNEVGPMVVNLLDFSPTHEQISLLQDLQSTHDNCFPDIWMNRLKRTARAWGLLVGAIEDTNAVDVLYGARAALVDKEPAHEA